ncbi:MAG: EamA family transporter RarD [Bdellovibrio sp.]|nr:EamA family transporter RarD [Bdellovibrio sp.]
MENKTSGFIQGASSYLIWGLAPLYFKALASISAGEVLIHRIVWSVVVLSLFLLSKKSLKNMISHFKRGKVLRNLIMSSLLVSSNWLIYIYAISIGKTVEASLGYFINPLFTILLGVMFFKESLSKSQLACLTFGAFGLLYQIYAIGSLSWIALAIPLTFGLYGLVRKKTLIDSVEGLLVETILVAPLAISFGVFLFRRDSLMFVQVPLPLQLLLIGTGLLTTIPLFLYNEGVKKLPFNYMGFLQYIAPTLQFLVGVYIFNEHFNLQKLISFTFIWFGLILLTISQIQTLMKKRTKIQRQF